MIIGLNAAASAADAVDVDADVVWWFLGKLDARNILSSYHYTLAKHLVIIATHCNSAKIYYPTLRNKWAICMWQIPWIT